MNDIYVKLELEAPQHNRVGAFGGNGGGGKEVAFGVYRAGKKLDKTEKENDVLLFYITQQQIVRAFVEIVKLSSVFEMLSSGEHKGNSFDHLITTALREMDAAVKFKNE